MEVWDGDISVGGTVVAQVGSISGFQTGAGHSPDSLIVSSS